MAIKAGLKTRGYNKENMKKKTTTADDIKLYKRLLVYIKPFLSLIAFSIVLALAVSGVDGAIALLVKPIMDNIFVAKDIELLKLIPWLLLALYFIKGISRFGQ